MAFQIDISPSNFTLDQGETRSTLYARLKVVLENNETTISAHMTVWRSESDYNNGKRSGRVTKIPIYDFKDILTGPQYANVNMTQVHNKIAAILEQGDSHPEWDAIVGPGIQWDGLDQWAANAVTVDMP